MKFLKNRRLLARMRAFVLVFAVVFSVLLIPFGSSAASSNISYIPLGSEDFPYLENNPSKIGGTNTDVGVIDDNTFLYTVNFPDGVNAGYHTVYFPFKLSTMPNSKELFNFSCAVEVGSDTNFWPDYVAITDLYNEVYYIPKGSVAWDMNPLKVSSQTLWPSANARKNKFDVHFDSVQVEADCFLLCMTVYVYVDFLEVMTVRVSDMSFSFTPSSPEYENNYNNFSSQGSEVDSYKQAEDNIMNDASDKFDIVKGSIFDNSLWNPDNITPLRGFITAGRIFENFSEIPAVSNLLKYSLVFGILAFILGLVILFLRRK